MTDLNPRICANEACTNEVVVPGGPGRPPIYCSLECRPTKSRGAAAVPLRVELDHCLSLESERPVGRIWMVRLRRGNRSVTIASDLGRPSADHLVAELSELLSTRVLEKGEAIG